MADISEQTEGGGPNNKETPPRALRVLVVDDNKDAARSLELLLSRWGHDIRLAHDGPGALEAATTFLPDVALLDIALPGLDGLGVATRLRQLPDLEQCLVIAVSGFAGEGDAQRSLAAGCDHHLAKPVDLDRLNWLLADAAGRL